MKRIFIMFAAVALLCACEKETVYVDREVEVEVSNAPEGLQRIIDNFRVADGLTNSYTFEQYIDACLRYSYLIIVSYGRNPIYIDLPAGQTQLEYTCMTFQIFTDEGYVTYTHLRDDVSSRPKRYDPYVGDYRTVNPHIYTGDQYVYGAYSKKPQ